MERNKLSLYYPDTGDLRRELYPQHLEFFRLGKTHSTRAFMAANRTGKTEGGGGYETTLHLTGRYPKWWDGRVFDGPINAWCAGDTAETVRDIIQLKLVGPDENIGTGLIPYDCIDDIKYRRTSNKSIDYVVVKHDGGGYSRLGFKSYDQGRESFQGTEKHLIWLDEESNQGIRSECSLRLMTTDGLLIETFTPLKGLTPVVLKYMVDGRVEDKRVTVHGDRAMVMAGWNDVPHLGEDEKKRMLAECEPHLVDARSRGIPSIGAGAIYPVPEEDIKIADFPIPDHWRRFYGMDVGWNCTAVVWFTEDPDTGKLYIYDVYKRGQSEPSVHASAIRARGDWIPGVIDPASRGRGQRDGAKLIEDYINLGLHVSPASNEVEASLYNIHQLLSSGMLKVFSSCSDYFDEYRVYRRNEKGQIVKVDDHIMDAKRYGINSGRLVAIVKPVGPKMPASEFADYAYVSQRNKAPKKSGLL